MDTTHYRKSGQYLKAADISRPMRLIITGCTEATFDEEIKLVLHFQGVDRGLVLGTKNLTFLQDNFGFESEDWTGQEVVLWNDTSVVFNGKAGSLRLRFPDAPPLQKQPPMAAPQRPARPAPAKAKTLTQVLGPSKAPPARRPQRTEENLEADVPQDVGQEAMAEEESPF